MSWLFRPWTLILVSVALAVLAGVLLLWPPADGITANRAIPRPLDADDQEIVCLYPATSPETWERFVTVIRRVAAEHTDPELEVDEANAFPAQTTDVPELAVLARGGKGRLWFRWYKLTGDLKTETWVKALTEQRGRAPLAIIGGSTSDRARDLAGALSSVSAPAAERPLLLITYATADKVFLEKEKWVETTIGGTTYHEKKRDEVNLMDIYPGRTFRFCFTNSQMAKAVVDFVRNHLLPADAVPYEVSGTGWGRAALAAAGGRPHPPALYTVEWGDDPYSLDLSEQFRTEFKDRESCLTLVTRKVLHSIGDFYRPNAWETAAADELMRESTAAPQQRPLLVLPAVVAPARRFLRGLAHTDPVEAGRFLVLTGDSIDFNNIYRDRNLIWPIQDLPFALVFFCHRNPVQAGRFQPDLPGLPAAAGNGSPATGTDALLLHGDVVTAVVNAAYRVPILLTSPEAFKENLAAEQLADGRPLFRTAAVEPKGNRPSGSGEHIVCLQPERQGNRVLPRARLQVWRWAADRRWEPVPINGSTELLVDYTQR
jgi:hypothetical protein